MYTQRQRHRNEARKAEKPGHANACLAWFERLPLDRGNRSDRGDKMV